MGSSVQEGEGSLPDPALTPLPCTDGISACCFLSKSNNISLRFWFFFFKENPHVKNFHFHHESSPPHPQASDPSTAQGC